MISIQCQRAEALQNFILLFLLRVLKILRNINPIIKFKAFFIKKTKVGFVSNIFSNKNMISQNLLKTKMCIFK